jgi:predicted amidophosphoribosyltransferase
MKKKGKTVKNQPKTMLKKSTSKVTVGEDEFCPTCMEWRAFDETTGKCKVCGRQIKKVGARSRTITEEYDLKDFSIEHDEQQDSGEY